MYAAGTIPTVVLLLGSFVFLTKPAHAQPDPKTFERFTTRDGLADNRIWAITQDVQGSIWLATPNGLSKYDGYDFTNYTHDPFDSTSLADNILNTLYIDTQGSLWLGTQWNGLDRFDPVTETFTHFAYDSEDSKSLSNNTVTAILEDREGALWVGTDGGGLNRFDYQTETFTHFRHDVKDPTSLIGDRVGVLYEDHQGTLWVGTGSRWGDRPGNEGLNRFNRDSETFTRYQHDPDDDRTLISDLITAIYEDSQGTFWVGTYGDGLHTMDRETGAFTRYTYDPANPNRPHRPRPVSATLNDHGNPTVNGAFRVTFIQEDQTGALWIGGSSGLDRYDRDAGLLNHYEHGDFTWANTNTAIYESREGVLWIATDNGLYRIPPGTSSLRYLQYNQDNANSMSENSVVSVMEDAGGTLWIGTLGGGLNKYERETGKVTHYRHNPDDPNSLSGNMVVSVYEAPSDPGILWISTYGDGLNKYGIETGKITCYRHDPDDPNSLSGNVVMAVYEAPSEPGILWIATLAGLNRLDVETEKFTAYTAFPDRRYRSGLFRVLSRLDRENRSIAALLKMGNDENLYYPFEIAEGTPALVVALGDFNGKDAYDYGWIENEEGEIIWKMSVEKTRSASSFSGLRIQLAEIQLSAGSYVLRYRSDDNTSYGDSWSDNPPPDNPERWGIQLYSLQGYAPLLTAEDTSEIDLSGAISGNIIYSMLEDRAGTFWVGTYNGLNILDRERGDFTTYLPGRRIYVIHEDRQSRFWLGTNSGLMRFYRNQTYVSTTADSGEPDGMLDRLNQHRILGMVEDEKGVLWITSQSSGLSRYDPDTQTFTFFDVMGRGFYIPGGIIRSRSGEIFVREFYGLMRFFPDEIINTVPPSVVLTGLRIYNEPVLPGPESLLDLPVGMTTSIALAYAQRDFTIDYAGLHYSEPARNQYMYWLEGYEEKWVRAGTQRSARYTGLPPGSYTFHVKAANSDGVWSEEGASIAITVLPPWWGTWWVYLCYGLLFAAGVFAVDRFQRGRLIEHERRQAGIREARIKAEAAEERAQILEEVDELKSRFFANLSHEFRTPLTLMLGPVQDVIQGRLGAVSDRIREQFAIVHRSGLRLQALIDQLLDLSRLEAGRLVLHCREYDAVAFVRTLVLSFSSLAERKRISLLFDGPDAPLPLYFDADKLEKVLVNLLSNAFKFTPEHGKILVRLADEGAFVHIRVSDTGSGIAAEDLPYIFDRFRQADGSVTRKQEGAGIGLALARELVELHGGTIEVESDAGFGATFTVRLLAGREHFNDEDLVDETYETATLALAEAAIATAESIEGIGQVHEVDQESDRKRSTVLIVEDNADVRTYLRGHLSNGYRVVEAVNGEEALKKARAEKPDLIVSDVMMPVMDGYELCKRLKEDKKLNHIPVVLLTARAGEEDRLEGLELGADDYLSKPFSAEELLVRVENLIQVRRLLRARFSEEVQLGPEMIVVSSQNQEFLARVQAVVEREMENSQLSVEQLADEVGLSARQLYRKMKETMDLTPAGYIRMMRLERAAQLLDQRAGTVSEIAYRVGFQDANYFSRLFRQSFGVSPSQYPTDLP